MPKTKQKASRNGKGRSFIFLILILIILGLCGLAGYTLYQLHNIKSTVHEKQNISSVRQKSVSLPAPIYIPLDAFTVSLKAGETGSDRVLYIGLTLRLKDENAKVLLEKFMPEIRSHLLILFSQQTEDELAKDSGKIELINKIKSVINLSLTDQHGVIVTDVLFNAFILR